MTRALTRFVVCEPVGGAFGPSQFAPDGEALSQAVAVEVDAAAARGWRLVGATPVTASRVAEPPSGGVATWTSGVLLTFTHESQHRPGTREVLI
jgi:hypothetical protein